MTVFLAQFALDADRAIDAAATVDQAQAVLARHGIQLLPIEITPHVPAQEPAERKGTTP